MTKEQHTVALNVRITPQDAEKLERLREARKADNVSQVTRTLIREAHDVLGAGNRSAMLQANMRHIAVQAARSQLRKMGTDPAGVASGDALEVLDDLARTEPELIASQWYSEADDAEVTRFEREWRQWRRDNWRRDNG